MTEDEAFDQLAHEAFAGFGWNLAVADIPDYHNIRVSIINARDRAPDYAAQHAVGKMADDPAFQHATQTNP